MAQLRRVGYVANLHSPAEILPKRVEEHRQATVGYLCAVASAHGLKLATFDTGINDVSVERIP